MNTMNSKCRICLSEGAAIPIFESKMKQCPKIVDKLRVCLGSEILDIQGYPRNLCKKCYCGVNTSYSLIKKFQETSALLKSKVLEPKEELRSNLKNEVVSPEFKKLETARKCSKAQQINSFTSPTEFQDLLKPFLKTEHSKCLYGEENTPVVHKFSDDPNEQSIVTIKHTLNVKEEENIEDKENIDPIPQMSNKKEINNNLNSASNLKSFKIKLISERKRIRIKNKIPSLCELCGKMLPSSDALRSHKTKHESVTQIQCPFCPRTYTLHPSLRGHLKKVHGEKKHVCPECGKMFRTIGQLNAHNRSVHLKIRPSIIKYPCKLCGKLYSTPTCALIHERSVHTGERPAVCDVCGRSFFHEVYLEQHRRLHTGETPYKCPVCGRAYAQRCNMKSHIKHNHRISQLDGVTLSTIDKKYFKYMKP